MVYFVNVRYYDECDCANRSETCVIIKDNYAEAARTIEDYYGNTLTSFEIAMVQDNEVCVFEDSAHISVASFKPLL